MDSVSRPQDNEEFVYDEHQGKMVTVVMDENKCCVSFVNFLILLLFCGVSLGGSAATIKLMDALDFTEDQEQDKMWWEFFSVFLNSILVAIQTKFFFGVVEYIVNRENHGSDEEFENSMINKSFVVSSFVCFGGLMLLAYWKQSFFLMTGLMIFLIIFK